MDTKSRDFLNEEIKRLRSGSGWIERHILAAIERYSPRAESVQSGRNRLTFFFPTYVIKVPRNMSGNSDNEHESCMGKYALKNRKNNRGVPMARTRLMSNEPIYIIAMERVEHLGWPGAEKHYNGMTPDWIDFVDCGQVGLTRSGEVVAYDYGNS